MADFNGGLVIAVLLCCLYRQVIGTEYLNLAMNYSEVIKQSSTYMGRYLTVAENAVDGFTDQMVSNGHCTHTNEDSPAWWRIQFKDRVYIKRIVIYHRNEDANFLKRFRGSRVYVSENGKCSGNLVYKQKVDPTNSWQDIFNITVNADGTYLVICNGNSNTKKFLQLCEVQVIGCPYGTYGDECALTCGNCYLSTCDLTSGICPDGCDSQYMGAMCNMSCIDRCQDSTCTKDGCIGCVTGKHGDYCEQQCPPNCELSTCSQQNGSCNGCKNNEFWNSDCSNKCPSNCNDTICNQDSGICYGCADGFWGSWCNQTCHNQCSKNVCNQINGNCSEGCSSGYWGNDCENKCPNNCSDSVCRQNDSGVCDGCTDGFWGSWCNQTCHNQCSKNVCNQINGNCSEGCSSGYWGNDCENKCPNNCSDSVCRQNDSGVCDGCTDGFWGSWCNQTCHNQCSKNVCNQIHGNCSEGCSSGYWGNDCENKCPNNCSDSVCRQNDSGVCDGCTDGFWGSWCNQTCHNQCSKNVCNQIHGNCSEGCSSGYWGNDCENKCPNNCSDSVCRQNDSGVCDGCTDGFWGSWCNQTCHNQCSNNVCNQINGNCSEGCSSGYWDNHCEKKCPNNCKDGVCRHNDSYCTYGCQPGYYNDVCYNQCGRCASEVCDHKRDICNGGCLLNFWGDYCNHSCPINCFESVCAHGTGICEKGCNTGYRGPNCTEENQSKASVTGDVAVTAGSIVGVIALAVIAVVLIIFVKRRRISKSTHTKPDISENETTFMIGSKDRISTDPGNDDRTVTLPTRCHREDTVIVDKTKPGAVCTIDGATVEDDGQYYNISKTSKEILVDDLKGYIKLQSKDGFHSVFAEILYGSQFAHDVGQRKENVPKNRFISIFPYDHSRVKLQELTEVPNSDYINANYIDSFDSKKVYIAAQGPKQNTIQDMWRMVVQEKCGKIVILTNLIEGQKKKCERYWPISVEKMEIANMTLTLKSEEVRPFYTIRNINVSVKRNGETETMSVTQFHFKSWPDHGVADPRQLVVFHRRVTQVKTSLPGPLIVHCSAGVGRTGTFIGLDSLVTYGRLNKRINVSGFVESMRNNRMNMVQNADQLQLLHEALLETLMYPNNSMSRTDFQKLYVQVQKRMSKEYQILQTMLPEYPTEQYSDATLEVNKDKNRNHCILPPNKYRPFISTFVSGTTDYINAVVVSGTVHDTKFLVTQLPLTNTVVDFWRMVYDHDSNVVVLLNPMDAKEKYPSVLPSEDRVIEVGRLNVKLVSKKTILSNITETVLNITQKNCEKKREVMALHTTSWRASEELPPTKKLILDLLTSVSTWQQEKGERPITVQCMNGATCSGLFCAISKIIQQIKFDQEVDIFQAVREMQICRPQFIQNEAQYRFCYDITMEYLNISDNDVYSNV